MGQTTIKSKTKINKYQENLQAKLQEIKQETDLNQDWQNLKQVILEAIQEKNEGRRKCLVRKTRINLDIYQQKRTKANRICRKKIKKNG
jgi:hypothetical protein